MIIWFSCSRLMVHSCITINYLNAGYISGLLWTFHRTGGIKSVISYLVGSVSHLDSFSLTTTTGGIIPGPRKPKNLDSFLFPGLHHIAALHREGMEVWDAHRDRTFRTRPFLALVTADGPAMANIAGTVGHTGKKACRFYCPLGDVTKTMLQHIILHCSARVDIPGHDGHPLTITRRRRIRVWIKKI